MRINLCGARGSTPTPGAEFTRYGGHTSCIAITPRGGARPRLILDAGTGIRTVAPLLGGEAFEGSLLLTHLHWDHVQGLPFFSGGDDERSRVRLELPAQPDGSTAEEVLARAMSPPFFPAAPFQLRGDWSFGTMDEGTSEHDELTVLTREVPHKGGRTFGFRVSDGHSTIAYVPDHCPTAGGHGPDGCGEYHDAIVELASGVDLLLHDAQLLPEELDEQGRFGHASFEYPLGLARVAGAAQVMLFHHHPERDDDQLDEVARRVAAMSESASLARQGLAVEL